MIVVRRFAFLLTMLTLAGAAEAREGADVARAVALFKEARADARNGNHAAACPKLRESYALDPAVGTLLNLADCDEREGHLVGAMRRFEDGLARLPATDARASYVRTRIHALDARIPRISGALGIGQRLFVDGHEVPIVPAAGHPLDPGRHELVVQRAEERASVIVVLAESERRALDFAKILPVAPVAVPEPTPEPTPTVAEPPETAASKRTRDRLELRRDREASRPTSPFFRMRREREWNRGWNIARRRVDP
jgi:hypothetical protein